MSARDQARRNRQNAQRSTGPKTEEGKAKSRLNALKDGFRATIQVLPGESHKEFNALTNAYLDDYQPQTQIECRFVAKLIDAEWRDQRLARQEREAWLNASTLPEQEAVADRYERRADRLHRASSRAFRDLEALHRRLERQAQESAKQSQAEEAEKAQEEAEGAEEVEEAEEDPPESEQRKEYLDGLTRYEWWDHLRRQCYWRKEDGRIARWGPNPAGRRGAPDPAGGLQAAAHPGTIQRPQVALPGNRPEAVPPPQGSWKRTKKPNPKNSGKRN